MPDATSPFSRAATAPSRRRCTNRVIDRLLFRRDSTPPRVVSDGKSLLLDSEMAGDEPHMLASNLKDVVVLVDKDRVKSGRYAIEQFGCDTLLLDDGFQYWHLRGRRHDVVLIDRQQPFGNEHMLPRGTLREPPFPSVARPHDFHHQERRQDEVAQTHPRPESARPIIECVHHPMYLEDVFTGERKTLDFIKGRKVASLSGIAQPESFEQSLVKLGAELVYSKRFADHHRFTQQEVLNAINRGKKRQAEIIITTQKDAVRFPETGSPRPADPVHARGDQHRERRGRLPRLRAQNLFPLTMDTLLYWFAKLLVTLLQALPLRTVARLGRAGGAVAFHLDGRHRRVALRNLTMCFPEKSRRKSAPLPKRTSAGSGRTISAPSKPPP
jgi:tetraacyldisaccharide 4'-kinase